jgi:integrase
MAKTFKRCWTKPNGAKREAWCVDYSDGAGNRHRPQFKTRKAADKFRVKVEGQLSDGIYRPDADKVTVKEVCEAFIENCEGRMRRNERMTRKMLTVYRGHVNNHILHSDHGVGQSKLSQVTARRVGDFRDALRNVGVTVPTTRKILATFHAVLEYAISQDWVATNAVHRVRVIGPRDEGSKKIVPPSKVDMRLIIEAAKNRAEAKIAEVRGMEKSRRSRAQRLFAADISDMSLKIVFAAATGLRAGEQWAVRWRDVDLDAGELTVTERVDCYGEFGPPKSAAGVRAVPLSSALVQELKKWQLRSQFSGDNDFVFSSRNGEHTCHDNLIKRHFRPLLEEAKVSGINWHSLRHYAVSTWIEAGLAPKTVQTFAGHSSLQVTMDRYGHLFPSDDHKAAMDAITGELMG